MNYQEEEKTFTMTQLAGMYMTDMKKIAEAALQAPVHDCVISVPAYYTDRQRHALLAASEIAGLNPLRLISEPAAAALEHRDAVLARSLGMHPVGVEAPDPQPLDTLWFRIRPYLASVLSYYDAWLRPRPPPPASTVRIGIDPPT